MKTDDISPTLTAKSDQLNAADLVGGAITVKILDISVNQSSDQPVKIGIGSDRQPYKPCKTMRRLLASLWGNYSKDWVGNSLTLYCDPEVLWAGAKAGGIRVSHATGIAAPKEIPLRASKHKVTIYTVQPLAIEKPAYSDADIDKNKDAWQESILDVNAKTTAAGLIRKIKTEFTLTAGQEKAIINLSSNEPEQ